MKDMFINLFGKTHIGNYRPENQDRYLTLILQEDRAVLAIADGLGGEANGSLAAETAIRFLDESIRKAWFKPPDLVRTIQLANDQILSFSENDQTLEGIGTTLTVALIESSRCYWIHVGDSRLFHFSKGKLSQITNDQRFLQEFIDTGDIDLRAVSVHPLRNQLDQCVGMPGVKPSFGDFSLENGDILMLTTDGLHDYILPAHMASVLKVSPDLPKIADTLIKAAMNAGSRDNLTIVLGLIQKG